MRLQAGLIGHERDKAEDEVLRRDLHAQWLERQDDDAVAQLMEGVRSGFRRKRVGDFLDEDVRSCLLMLRPSSRPVGGCRGLCCLTHATA